MIRIAALNDNSGSESFKESPNEISTKEAQEEAAFSLYNQALQLQNEGNLERAEMLFRELLQVGIVQDVCYDSNVDTAKSGVTPSPALVLKYSTYKNIANIANKRGDYEDAMESYLEAVALDSSDVTLWFRIGVTSLKIYNYSLGSLAFQEALKCNPNHWPSLDHIITILYILNDYYTCLYYISRALEHDVHYLKGLSFRDQIFREHPGLRQDTAEFFYDCVPEVFNVQYNKAEGKKLVDEALEMRSIKQQRSRPTPPPLLNFVKPLISKTWKNLGECLVDLYDLVHKAERPISFSCRVNLKKYVAVKESDANVANTVPPKSFLPSFDQESEMADVNQTSTPDVVMTKPSTESENVTPEQVAVINEVDESQGDQLEHDFKKSKKRKKPSFSFVDAAAKRRSARVRNTVTKKQQEYVDFTQLLQKFLPSSLLSCTGEEGNDNSQNGKSLDGELSTSEDGQGDSGQERDWKAAVKPLHDTEEKDVRDFLQACVVNTGVLDVMYRFLIALSERHNLVWPLGLMSIYSEVYIRVREHITHPSIFCQDRDNEEIKDEAYMTLCFAEFKMDKWMQSKMQHSPNPGMPSQCLQVPSIPIPLGADFPGKHFSVDLDFLIHLTVRNDIFKENSLEYCLKVWWLKARYFTLTGQMDYAIDCFQLAISLLKAEQKNTVGDICFNLVNCTLDKEITLDHLQRQLEALQQCQSLEELHRLHHSNEYQKVVDILILTFNTKLSRNKMSGNKSATERHSQLLLLQECLWNLGDQQQCLYWGEASFHEALQQYETDSNETRVKNEWANTLVQILTKLERCFKQNPGVIHTLSPSKLKRFIKNLIKVIVIQMETPDSVTDMPIKTTVPWILLYYAIQQEEEKIRSLMVKSTVKEDENMSNGGQHVGTAGCDSDFGPGMPSSLMLLYSAHEYLGRRSWCNYSDGALLLLYSDLLVKELQKSTSSNPHPYKEDLEISAEQCFFCLYGHPNKRTKAKHLQEHGSLQVALTWEQAIPLFNYFKPKQLPEFDSLKAITVSAEFEYLLRRIFCLIPPDDDPTNRVDAVCAYIEGGAEEIPEFDPDLSTRPIISELYYLLADYYFKNNEQGKAIKFYLLDVAVCPDRFDSWAGMALARSSQLEQKLNSCELKNEGPIYRKATAALRCFAHALELDPSTISLWIEHGTLAYVLHSYTCRQLKQTVQLELGTEAIQMLTTKREELLSVAQCCFKSANQCEESAEEEWLHHYMLGKIAEKMDLPPKEYLHHYKLAAMHLQLEGAWYPRKIQYHNPPNFSMEALEVYYRTHASILKFLLRNEGKPIEPDTRQLLEAFLKDAEESAFANFQEKRHGSQNVSDVEDSAVLLEECRKLRKVNPLANDHDYFKRKRKNSNTDETEMGPRHRQSIDSSSESQDSAAVKDVLNSIVSVVSEQMEEALDKVEGIEVIVMGDTKIVRPTATCDKTQDGSRYSNERSEKDKYHDGGTKLQDRKSSQSLDDDDGEDEEAEAVTCESSTSEEDLSTSSKDASVSDSCNDHRDLIKRCIEALKQCLHRFPQHYKSLYRIAHYYFTSKYHKNMKLSKDYLLGPQQPWQQCLHMTSQALFAERKNTNFFNGIWRIPIDEIDRPGSFASHMYRSITLVLDILEESRDHNLMVHLAVQLHRNPDAGKKYLRDVDRLYLAKMCYDRSITLLLEKMKSLCNKELRETDLTNATKHLMEIYRAWQNFQKVISDQEGLNNLLAKAYAIFNKGKGDSSASFFDQAVRYCQQQQTSIRTPQLDASKLDDTSTAEPSTQTLRFSCQGGSKLSLEDLAVQHANDHLSKLIGNLQTRTACDTRVMKSILSPPFHALSSPNLLTAAVQSRIKSLDPPIESFMHATQKMSGFQLEFLRQITGQASSTSILKTSKLLSHDAAKKQDGSNTKDSDRKPSISQSSSPRILSPSIKPCFVQLEAVKVRDEHQD